MKKILVTGSKGQLGMELQEISSNYTNFKFAFHDVDTLDITNRAALHELTSSFAPDYIINCAAYTAVDQAEKDEKTAMLINGTAPGLLAEVAKECDAYLIHVSTDYVFDGTNHTPYKEIDLINPKSVYGMTKLEGEKNVIKYNKGIVVRTSWLYSVHGKNFVKTMLRLTAEKESLKVVFDQIGTPTNAADLASGIMTMVNHLINNNENIPQLFHFSNEGVCSWYDFAWEINSFAQHSCFIHPVLSSEFPLPAPRPFYSVLNKALFTKTFSFTIPYWKESLYKCLSALTKI